jgi:hypothetical protein
VKSGGGPNFRASWSCSGWAVSISFDGSLIWTCGLGEGILSAPQCIKFGQPLQVTRPSTTQNRRKIEEVIILFVCWLEPKVWIKNKKIDY